MPAEWTRVVVDEPHHLSARGKSLVYNKQSGKVLSNIKSRHRWGLSATAISKSDDVFPLFTYIRDAAVPFLAFCRMVGPQDDALFKKMWNCPQLQKILKSKVLRRLGSDDNSVPRAQLVKYEEALVLSIGDLVNLRSVVPF